MRLRRIAALLFALAIAGCATAPAPVPDQGLVPAETIALRYQADHAWWKLYGDENLNKIVDMALANNIDLKQTAISVNKALYNANLLGEELIPEFSGSAGATTSTNTKEGITSHSYSAELGVSYEIDLWRKLSDAATAQEWEYKATKKDLESARLALINNTVSTYFHLVYLNQAIRVTEENVTFYEDLWKITQSKHELGKADALEPLTAEKSYLSAKTSLMTLETTRKTVEQTLRDLLNLRPEDKLPEVGADILLLPSTDVDLDVPVAALGLRPDVKAAEYRLQTAFYNWESMKAEVYPSVTIGGSLGVSDERARRMFNAPLLGGLLQINLPFLQWNKLRWNIKLSEAEFEAAKLDLTSAVNTALNEVDTYYYSYTKSLSLLDNAWLTYSNNTKISEYNRHRYESGRVELSEWLDALCTMNTSLLTLLESKYNTITYENAIYKAMGARLTKNPAKAEEKPTEESAVPEQTAEAPGKAALSDAAP